MTFDPNDVNPANDVLEMNWVGDVSKKGYGCDKCGKKAVVECEVNIYSGQDRKSYGVYCKQHFDSLFDDIAEELEQQEPYDTEEDD